MNRENPDQHENAASNIVEDLTLNEIASENVKGGAVDMLLRLTDLKGDSKGDVRE